MLIPDPFPSAPAPTTVRPRPAPDLGAALERLNDRYLEPFRDPASPEEQRERDRRGPSFKVNRIVAGSLEAVSYPEQVLDTALAFSTVSLGAAVEWPAATQNCLHMGSPHKHLHSLLSPPLTSVGPIRLGNCVSVLIHGQPAARVGDIGLAASCGTLTPFYEIKTGSSKVFIGGARAARNFDLTLHCHLTVVTSWKELAVDLLVPAAADAGTVLSEYLAADESSQRAKHTGMDADAEDDRARAESLAADSKGHALAAGLHSAQAMANLKAGAARLLMGKDPGIPTCLGQIITGHADVLIGGFPVPPSMDMVKAAFSKPLSPVERALHGIGAASFGFMTLARQLNVIDPALRHYTGHPVDVVTGNLVFDAVDLDLPGTLPLRLTRHYSSSWSPRNSPLGRGWSHSLDEAVWLESRHIVYRAEDGREIEFPRSDASEIYAPLHRLTLRHLGPDRWQIEDHEGIRRDFAAIAGDPRPGQARLIERSDRVGHSLRLHYDEHARLVSVHADGDRKIRLHHDEQGRLIQVDLPNPDADGFVPHIRYVHESDDLVEIHDALGQVTRYQHDRHRIIHETLPTGLCFHFEYDSETSDAACVRTWGDGGILDHRLIYDRARRTTVVINACNETTTYRADPRGLVTEIVDPRGATTRFEYDERMLLTSTIDALGHVTRHEHDARGNCTRTTGPDGAITTTQYDPNLDLPILRTDPAGGTWRWTYDPCGRLVRATDPLGRSTVHHHELSEGTHHVEAIVSPDGRSELRTHDQAGRLIRHRPPDGSKHTFFYDRRGRLRQHLDDRGRSETREYDLLGRLTRHALPTGETRLYSHDARGRIIRTCDDRSDLRCGYNGLGWLATCGEASAAPYTLERDLEGRINRVAGPAGTLLRIERDAAGQVRSTVDALGIARRYTRDLLGRVVAVRRPGGKLTRYTRDPAGRVTEIAHDDGVRDSLSYRADGALQAAVRTHADGQVTTVRRELDALGRVTREYQDDHAVALEYDLRDRLTRLRSSVGADLRFVYDERGLSRVEIPHEPWALAFERDRDGREQARHLPGEILSWWQTDRLGRPAEHGIVASRPPQIHRQRRYAWTGTRLDRIEETARRRPPTLPPLNAVASLQHDAEGRRLQSNLADGTSWKYQWSGAGELIAATTTDTTISYRHDALGRRISRTCNGVETRWFWHGDVPLHSWTDHGWRDAATWVFEPGGFTPLARITPTSRHAIVGDQLGTPLAAFDERGQLSWSAEFDERGQPRTVRGDASVCPFRFPGQTADPDTGLSYNRFREYDPATGHYLSPDPLGLLGGLDPYAYVDDPRTHTDVYGLSTDQPTSPAAYLVSQMVPDIGLNDFMPFPLSHVFQRTVGPADTQTMISIALGTPRPGPCD